MIKHLRQASMKKTFGQFRSWSVLAFLRISFILTSLPSGQAMDV